MEAITVPVVIGALCFARKGWRNTPKFWITSEYKNGRKITLGGLRWSQSLAHCTVPMCLHESLKIQCTLLLHFHHTGLASWKSFQIKRYIKVISGFKVDLTQKCNYILISYPKNSNPKKLKCKLNMYVFIFLFF